MASSIESCVKVSANPSIAFQESSLHHKCPIREESTVALSQDFRLLRSTLTLTPGLLGYRSFAMKDLEVDLRLW